MLNNSLSSQSKVTCCKYSFCSKKEIEKFCVYHTTSL